MRLRESMKPAGSSLWKPRFVGGKIVRQRLLLIKKYLATTNQLKFHACERGYFFLVLFNAMSANISEEVLTSKRQGLSEEERLRERERARNNRQRSSAGLQVNS